MGWVCIAKKNEFKVGDTAVYIEIDSKCPDNDERFKFLESKHYKVKTMKLGKFKVISQGLALPIKLFPELKDKTIGDDVTKELGITYSSLDDIKRKSNKVDSNDKYKSMEIRLPKIFKKRFIKKIMKYEYGRKFMFLIFGKKEDVPKEFPNWIIKTDEDRIENCPYYLKNTDKWIKTEKLDGTSCTYAIDKNKNNTYEFIVCSRNKRLTNKDNIYWELASKYNIENVLINFAKEHDYHRVVLQGEGVGFVQKNPYKLNENKLFIFNLIINGTRLGTIEMAKFCEENGLLHVPIIDTAYILPKIMEDMKLEADGYSEVNPKVKREGFVYRSIDGQKSFKNVSREYLLKHNG